MEEGVFCEDILVCIFSRLPKKCLYRFKCVSKGWCALISDRNRVLPKATDAGFLCNKISSINGTAEITFFRVDREGNASPDHSLSFSSEKEFLILDSCNGLLLFQKVSEERCLYVYNPSTKNSFHLPLPQFQPTVVKKASLAFDGKHFKVIRISDGHLSKSFYLKIFSSQTGQWREIQLKASPFPSSDLLPPPSYLSHSLSLKGAIHWIWGNFLVIYHLEAEYGELIRLPMQSLNRDTVKKSIWDSEGRLHYCEGDEFGIRIWVLHIEWKLKHSIILNAPMLGKGMWHYKYFEPLAFNDDFGILYLMYNSSILSYNLATRMLACAYPLEAAKLFRYHTQPFSFGLVESP